MSLEGVGRRALSWLSKAGWADMRGPGLFRAEDGGPSLSGRGGYSGLDAPGEARGERKQEICQGPSGVQSGDCGRTAQGVYRMESVGSGLCGIVPH